MPSFQSGKENREGTLTEYQLMILAMDLLRDYIKLNKKDLLNAKLSDLICSEITVDIDEVSIKTADKNLSRFIRKSSIASKTKCQFVI